MEFICGIISIVFLISAVVTMVMKNDKTVYLSIGSLVFTSLTIFMEYRQVYDWVNFEDWAALADVVPSMFNILIKYLAVMLLFNMIVLTVVRKRENN